MGARLKKVMAVSRHLLGPICQDDIKVIAGCWSWMEKDTCFRTIWPDLCMMLEFGL
jgi:hypothetical protein